MPEVKLLIIFVPLLMLKFNFQLDVNTVAAGGGSMLFFRDGMFVVGPESAGKTIDCILHYNLNSRYLNL